MYVYFFTTAATESPNIGNKMWIPLDFLLTVCISLYQVFYHYVSSYQDQCDGHSDEDPESYFNDSDERNDLEVGHSHSHKSDKFIKMKKLKHAKSQVIAYKDKEEEEDKIGHLPEKIGAINNSMKSS